jgi:hypothetical protein
MNERDFYLVASFGVFFAALVMEAILLRARTARAQALLKDDQ